jgi:hypothetical protein
MDISGRAQMGCMRLQSITCWPSNEWLNYAPTLEKKKNKTLIVSGQQSTDYSFRVLLELYAEMYKIIFCFTLDFNSGNYRIDRNPSERVTSSLWLCHTCSHHPGRVFISDCHPLYTYMIALANCQRDSKRSSGMLAMHMERGAN